MMRRAVLIGNPSVGKSLIFNHLTGLGVEVSNYPGTTVGLMTAYRPLQRNRVFAHRSAGYLFAVGKIR